MAFETHGSAEAPLEGYVEGNFLDNFADTYYIKVGSSIRFNPKGNGEFVYFLSDPEPDMVVHGIGSTAYVTGNMNTIRTASIGCKRGSEHGAISLRIVSGEVVIPINSVSVTGVESKLVEGNSMTVTAVVDPSNATDVVYSWQKTGANQNLYDISPSGKTCRIDGLTGSLIGHCSVVVKASNSKGSKSHTFDFQVVPDKVVVPIESVTVVGARYELKANETMNLTAKVNPPEATDVVYKWFKRGGSQGLYDIYPNGNTCTVVGADHNSSGFCEIVVQASNEASIKSYVVEFKAVPAYEVIPVDSITLSGLKSELKEGQIMTLKANISPEDASVTSIDWVKEGANQNGYKIRPSGDTCEVEGIERTTVGHCSMYVRANYPGGSKVLEFTFKVVLAQPEVPVTNIELSGNPVVGVDSTTRITCTVSPPDAYPARIIWSMDQSSTQYITFGGTSNTYCDVVGIREGKAVLTATSKDSVGTSKSIDITVVAKKGNTYEIIFDTQGGYPQPDRMFHEGYETGNYTFDPVPKNQLPEKENYKLLGWDLHKNATVPRWGLDTPFEVRPNTSSVMYAIYEYIATEYKLSFNANGGDPSSLPPSQEKIIIQDTYQFTIPKDIVPVFEGYVFKTWADSKALSNTYLPGETITLYKSRPQVVLNAIWELQKPTSIYVSVVSGYPRVLQGNQIDLVSSVVPEIADKQVSFDLLSGAASNTIVSQSSSQTENGKCRVQANGTENFILRATSLRDSNISGILNVKVDRTPIVHGSVQNPLEEVTGTLDTYPGDTIYIALGGKISITSRIDPYLNFNIRAIGLTPSMPGVTLDKGSVKGTPSSAGTYNVEYIYTDALYKDLPYNITLIVVELPIQGIGLLAPRSIDLESDAEVFASLTPGSISAETVIWSLKDGSGSATLASRVENNEAVATVKGVSTGDVTVRAAYGPNPSVFAEKTIHINGESFGSLTEPLDGFTGTLADCIGDSIFIKQGTSVSLESQNAPDVRCEATSIDPNPLKLEIDLLGSVSGNAELPGVSAVRAFFLEPDLYPYKTNHIINIHSVPKEGAVADIKVRNLAPILVNDTLVLEAEVIPADAKIKDLAWTLISGDDVISLGTITNTDYGGSCEITGLKEGDAQIRIESTDGVGAFKLVNIKVVSTPPAPDTPLERADDHVVSYIDVRHGDTATRIVFPIVSAIEDSHTVSLSEISTIIYGAECRFVMDKGSSKRYSVTIKRVNPIGYNDEDVAHPERWSNGKWYNNLKKTLDFWQNLGLTPNMDPDSAEKTPYIQTGGFMFHYLPPKYDPDSLRLGITDSKGNPLPFTMFPEIHEVVFLVGSITPSFGVQTLSLKLPLQVARMTGRTERPTTKAIAYNSNITGAGSFTRKVPISIPIPMPLPIDTWKSYNNNYDFKYWTVTAADTSIASEQYRAGQMVIWDDSTDPVAYYAQWQQPIEAYLMKTPGTFIVEIPSAAVKVKVYLCGGGGGGAGGGKNPGSQGAPTGKTGGAGGGGQYIEMSLGVRDGGTLEVKVGAGGAGGESPFAPNSKEDGRNGGDSIVRYEDKKTITATGGAGGQASTVSRVGKGGAYYAKGGDGANPGKDGNNGEGVSGGEGSKSLGEGHSAGGSGGGSPDALLSVVNSKGEILKVESRGGNGQKNMDGKDGGGGGSSTLVGGKGGNGFALLVFFG